MDDFNAQLEPDERFVRMRLYEVLSVRWQVDVDNHTLCAMTNTGRIFCRGYRRGIDRELAKGLSLAMLPSDADRERPGAWVEGVEDAIDFDLGFTFGCAVRRTGGVVCWGSGSHGQLGPGHRKGSRSAVPIEGLTDAVAIATSYRFACALRATGRVECWGDNPVATDPRRMRPTEVPWIEDATDLASDDWGVCARVADGSAECWRSVNDSVQDFAALEHVRNVEESAWIFAAAPSSCRWRAGDLSCSGGEGKHVVELDRHRDGACVRLDDGTVECTGTQRRPLTMVDFATRPQRVAGLPDDLAEIDAGTWTSCARTHAGAVWCWGYDPSASLSKSALRFSGVPRRRNGLETVNGLGLHWSFGVDPLVFVNGGAQRLDDEVAEVQPLPTRDEVGGRGERLCTRARQGRFSCVSTWGGYDECSDPPEHPFAVFGVDGPRAVDQGGRHGCAIDRRGRVWCFGDDDHAQVGVRASAPACKGLPAVVDGVRDAVDVCTGALHTCVLRRGGAVKCWGDNGVGQLGDDATRRAEPREVPGLPTATSLQCGAAHTCVTTKDGSVWCWGLGGWGQRGIGDREATRATSRVDGLPPVAQLALGMDHACALGRDRSVWCWGSNMFGQTGGGGSPTDLEQPHRMPELSR